MGTFEEQCRDAQRQFTANALDPTFQRILDEQLGDLSQRYPSLGQIFPEYQQGLQGPFYYFP